MLGKQIIASHRRLAALGAGVLLVLPVALAISPAQASLTPGTGWTSVTLPANYQVADGAEPVSPVSCVVGTQFCVAVVSDLAVTGFNNIIGQADVVTTDGGQHWTGYAALPVTSMIVTAISCASESSCWIAGSGDSGQAIVAQSTDGGQTWADVTPQQWGYDYIANGIDCVTASTCWVVGLVWNPFQPDPNGEKPWAAETTDGGTTWTTAANLPSFPAYSDNGTYRLNDISCSSVLDCVAVGGLNESDGLAQVITTSDGGATWSRSADPVLSGMPELFGVSCVAGSGGLPVCNGAATALAGSGPVEVRSTDGGATWTGVETKDNTGWLSSVSCADARHCWATGAGTTVALAGTADAGTTWSVQKSETTNEEGAISCATISVCVATTDNALWVTASDGGLPAIAPVTPLAGRGSQAVMPAGSATRALPHVSPPDVWTRDGHSATITGQYRGTVAAKSAAVVITLPSGQKVHQSASIGLNHYYSVTISKVIRGVTTVSFSAGNAPKKVVRLHGHPDPAPAISALSTHAGQQAGGTTVVITGTNFAKVTKVMFGSAAGTSLKVWSTTRLAVRAPAGTGARYVTVVTSGGGPSALTGRAVYNYLPVPVVRSVSPVSGPAAGGTRVTITGTGLAFIKAVRFGGQPASHLTVISARQITVVAPAGTGTVDVRVSTAGGTSTVQAGDAYSYQ